MTKSIGNLLKQERENKKMSLQDVHKFIKIHPKYLAALETDDYSVFEGKVHAKGFLKIYCDFLALDLNEVMAIWRREYEMAFEKGNKKSYMPYEPVEKEKFVFTPQLVVSILALILIVGFFAYLFYQYKTYTGAPQLDIYYPQNNTLVTEDIIDLTGKTQLDAEVYVNNQKLVLNTDGSFATSIKLQEGINTLNINAINKLDKKVEVVRTIIYRPANKNVVETVQSSESTPTVSPTGALNPSL